MRWRPAPLLSRNQIYYLRRIGTRPLDRTPGLTLQRHFSALPKFAHVESRFCGRKRRGKAIFDVPINPCVRDACSKSVAVGLYGGIDLHANNSVVVLLNEQDQVIYQKRLHNNLTTKLEPLSRHHREIEGVVVESTYNWYWLVDGLMEVGYRVHLANPAAIQQYSGLKYTDDHSDARWLAHLLRLGVLPEGYIYPKAARAVRDLLRKRAHLVRQHTANVLSVQNIMARNTGTRFSVKRIQELTKQELTSLLAEETQVLAVTSSLVVLDCLRHQIKALEQTVHKRLHHTPSYEQLLTVQGIGTILAQTITLET